MIGSVLVQIAFGAIVLSGGAYFVAFRKGSATALNVGRYAFHTTAALVLAFSALLLYLILTHQFQYTYVWNYSSTDLPTPLLISTFYAGQEGSFTLWALYTTIIGVFLLEYTSRKHYEVEVMMIWSLIMTFLLLMLIVKNPFAYIWDSFPSDLLHSDGTPPPGSNFVWLDQAKGIWAQFPVEGKGLNPLLQNYWMVIHPQVLFTGFSSMAVPYTFALAGLLRRDYTSWVRVAKPWTVFSSAVLGTGIILGGYWAYETLGWGGYWGWDPVENSSLIPWLVAVASIHTMLAQTKSGTFVRTNFALSILTYIMVLYSTFLTRSGVLGETSVHSFVDPGMWAYWLLLGVIAIFACLGFGILLLRMREMPRVPAEHSLYSREFALYLGAFTITFAALFITVGTSSPIITNILKGKAAAVDMSYYVKTTLPLGIVVALLAGLGQLLWWRASSVREVWRSVSLPAAVAAVFMIGAIIVGVRDVGIALFTFAAAFALVANILVGYRIYRGNPKYAGGAIAHIGVALLFLGFITSARYDEKQTVTLEQGKPVKILGDYTLTYRGNRPIDAERYGFDVRIEHAGRTFLLTPVMRFSSFTGGTMRHPDILNMYSKDFYLSPLSVEAPGEVKGEQVTFAKGETKELGGVNVTFVDFDFNDEEKGRMVTGENATIGVLLEVAGPQGKEKVVPQLKRSSAGMEFVAARTKDGRHEFRIVRTMANREDPAKSQVELSYTDGAAAQAAPKVEALVVEASLKPYINLVWMGTITLIVGFVLTIFRRLAEARLKS
jgi:cytochrome c-type biogenesis protein CcmF